MIECENNEEFIIANLSSSVFNETLDLAFNEGEKICFKVDGPGTVHLTGNLLDEDNMPPTGEGFDMLGGSDSEMESEEEEAGDRIKEVVEKPAGKRKKVEEVKSQEVVAKKVRIVTMMTMKVVRREPLMQTQLPTPLLETMRRMIAKTAMMKMTVKTGKTPRRKSKPRK